MSESWWTTEGGFLALRAEQARMRREGCPPGPQAYFEHLLRLEEKDLGLPSPSSASRASSSPFDPSPPFDPSDNIDAN